MKKSRESPAVAEMVVDGAAAADADRTAVPGAGGEQQKQQQSSLLLPFSWEEREGEREQAVQTRQETPGEASKKMTEGGDEGRSQPQEPAEEEDGDDGKNEDGEEEDEEGEEEEERPKLDEGFYEIEDIRKKRVVKGQLQYLIKWRGWPETANTWEPYDNIQSCADIIHSFEERCRSHPRKRKRKSGGLGSVTKKKHQQRFRIATSANTGKVAALGKEAGESKTAGTTDLTAPDPKTMEIVVAQDNKVDDGDHVRAPRFTEESVAGGLAVHLRTSEEDGTTDSLSNVKCLQPVQGGSSFTGARKRKSTHVKRFDPSEARQGTTVTSENGPGGREEKRMEHVTSVADESTKVDDGLTSQYSVAKILMPVEFSTSMSNNVQDVSVTFKALRSDGKEMLVTNRTLKDANPQLLINFYEQHLRYDKS